jgi:hypothetical protein
MAELTDDEFRAKYIHQQSSVTPEERQKNLSDCEKFIAEQEAKIKKMEARRLLPVHFDSEERVEAEHIWEVKTIKTWVSKVTDKTFAFQLAALYRLLAVTHMLRDYLIATPNTLGDFAALRAVARGSVVNTPEYKKLRIKLRMLQAKIRHIITFHLVRDILQSLQTELVNACRNFDNSISHSPPSPFDSVLEEYIRQTSGLSVLVEPAAMVIAEGTAMSLLATLSEFNLQLMQLLNITTKVPSSVVYASLVRFLFNVGYAMRPQSLMGTDKENIEFLRACSVYASQTVQDLRLPSFITKKYTIGLPVHSLFKQKQVQMLKEMELMTNPIDLMHHVHKTLGNLASIFGSHQDFLSFDDTLTLLLALMSLSPPGNAVAIAGFVVMWEPVQLSSVVQLAKNYFVAAVKQIQGFELPTTKV